MGHYYNPAKEIITAGRRLGSGLDYAHYQRLLGPGEQLIGLLDRGIYHVAPYLPDEREFDEFQQAYARGLYLSFQLYALPALRSRKERNP